MFELFSFLLPDFMFHLIFSTSLVQVYNKSKYYSKLLNHEVKKRGKKGERKWVVSLQSASTQEPRNLVRETGGLCINDEGLNHYTNRLRGRLQKSLQPAAS